MGSTTIRRELPAIIAKLRPEAVVISSFNRILPPDILALSRFVNVHYSPLPRYRGRANVNWAIIDGEGDRSHQHPSGAPGLDNGNILFQEQVKIAPTDTAQSLYERLNAIQERSRSCCHTSRCRRSRIATGSSAGDIRLWEGAEDGEIEWTSRLH